MDVKGLTPQKKYKFRVSAVNEEGESIPLEGDEEIVAKDPFGESGIKFFLMLVKKVRSDLLLFGSIKIILVI